MIATTFRGEQVYLLNYRPNWQDFPEVVFTAIGNVEAGLNQTEARTSYADTMRVRFRFSLFLDRDESASFRVGLQRQSSANRRLLVPFWPCATLYYDGGSVYTNAQGEFYVATGSGQVYVSTSGQGCWLPTGVWLTFEPDFSAFEIHETDMPAGFTPSNQAVRVPLMLGILEETPEPEVETPRLLSARISFRETGPADMALRSVPLSFASGPSVAGRTPSIFPLLPNWATPIQAGGAQVQIEREEIGFGRAPAETYYQQLSRRVQRMGFLGPSWDEIARVIAFFFQRQGMVESFWIQSPCDEVSLTAASSAISTTINVDRAANIGDNRFIFIERPGAGSALRHIETVDTNANTLTLDTPPGVFQPGQSRITQLILARFSRPDLTVRFFTDRVAEAEISFIECPQEYFLPAGETPGVTSGALPRKAYLFRFRQDFPSTTRYWRFTSYERDLIVSGETFLARPLEHSSLVDDLEIDRCRFTLQARMFTDNPLGLFVPFSLEVPLWCDLLECSPSNNGTASGMTLLATGRVSSPSFSGPIVECEVVSPFQELGLPLPTMRFQPTCNWRLFSGPCGLSESAWTFTGTVLSVSGNQVTLGSLSFAGGTLPILSAGYFAYGRFWSGSGTSFASRTIFDSMVPAAGQVRLTLASPITPAPSGTVNFSPGCSGLPSSCSGKFSNFARHGAFLYTPPGNPTLIAVRNTPQGGKK